MISQGIKWLNYNKFFCDSFAANAVEGFVRQKHQFYLAQWRFCLFGPVTPLFGRWHHYLAVDAFFSGDVSVYLHVVLMFSLFATVTSMFIWPSDVLFLSAAKRLCLYGTEAYLFTY